MQRLHLTFLSVLQSMKELILLTQMTERALHIFKMGMQIGTV